MWGRKTSVTLTDNSLYLENGTREMHSFWHKCSPWLTLHYKLIRVSPNVRVRHSETLSETQNFADSSAFSPQHIHCRKCCPITSTTASFPTEHLCLQPAHVAEWLTHSAAMCSRAWCAQWPRLGQGASAYLRIISNNSYTHDGQGDNLGPEKEGSMESSINCDRCRHLDLTVSSLHAEPAWVEVNKLGWPLAGIIHSASQG